jgi:lipid A 3-O-deacylase
MDDRKNAFRGLALKGTFAAAQFGARWPASAEQFGVQVAGGVGDRQIKSSILR